MSASSLHFSFESYTIAADENYAKTIYISCVKNKNT